MGTMTSVYSSWRDLESVRPKNMQKLSPGVHGASCRACQTPWPRWSTWGKYPGASPHLQPVTQDVALSLRAADLAASLSPQCSKGASILVALLHTSPILCKSADQPCMDEWCACSARCPWIPSWPSLVLQSRHPRWTTLRASPSHQRQWHPKIPSPEQCHAFPEILFGWQAPSCCTNGSTS